MLSKEYSVRRQRCVISVKHGVIRTTSTGLCVAVSSGVMI